MLVEKPINKLSGKIKSKIEKTDSQTDSEKSNKSGESSQTDDPESSSPRSNFCLPKLRQLKYILQFLTSKEKLVIKILLGIIAISTIFLAVRFYTNYLESVPSLGGEYTEAIIGAPQFINPVLGVTSDIDKDLTNLIYSGLLKYNKNQELIPDLASNYTISEDQKIYTFYLKENALWHDGQPFTSDDVVFTIKTIQNPEYKSPLYVSFKGVKIEKNDNDTIKFILEEPFAPFLSILIVGILPRHLWKNTTPEQFGLAVYNTKPIGTGPYKFKSLSKQETGVINTYSLEINDKYYNHPPYIKNLNFKFYSSTEEILLALKNKNVDGLSYVPKELKENLKKSENLNIIPLRLPQYTAVFFNQTNNAFIKSKNIRQALALAIDKERIINQALNRGGEIIHGPILSGSIGYNPDIRHYEFNIEEARELIKNAGFVQITAEEYQELINMKLDLENSEESTSAEENPSVDPSAKSQTEENVEPSSKQTNYLQKGNEILEINFVTVSQSENQKTAEIIKEAWENIGVKVNLEIVPPTKIREIIKTRNYHALLYGIITGFDPDPYPFWHSSQNQDPGLNLSVFSNKEVDYVLEDARKTSDKQIRHDKYVHFQNILVAEIPAIFLYSPTYTYALDKKIKGFEITRIAQPSDRFIGIEDWYINTKKVIKW